MKKYNVLDLFAGVGGLSYGFAHDENFEILAANEIEHDISVAYTLNHPTVNMLNCSIDQLTPEMLKQATGGKCVDIVVGGPPCQSYSTLGKRQMDARANLFKEYKRVLQILDPKAFIFENVSGLLSMDGGRLFSLIQDEFRNIGYDLKFKVLDAVNYGVPQHRDRVILVGFKGKNDFKYPEPTHGPGLKPYVTLRDALDDLPKISSAEQANRYAHAADTEYQKLMRANVGSELIEHKAPKNGERLVRIMKTLKEGQDKFDLPEDIRPKSGYPNTYAKLWWDQPSTTITRNFATPSSSRCIHPRDSRAMSIREGARLQSFPDDYKFYGGDGMKKLEIGNAVPPLLSVALARQMALAIKKQK